MKDGATGKGNPNTRRNAKVEPRIIPGKEINLVLS
jgi:hypothetical protein